MKALPFHPAAGIFPLMPPDDLSALAADIKANGQKDPILRWRGLILDGRNRFLACQKAGIVPRFEEWDGDGSPVKLVASLNLHRRHLNSGQRACVGVLIAEGLLAEGRSRSLRNLKRGRCSAPATLTGRTRDVVGESLTVSGRYIQQAMQVRSICDRFRPGSKG